MTDHEIKHLEEKILMALLDTLTAATQVLKALEAKLNQPPAPKLTPEEQAALDALSAEVTAAATLISPAASV